MTLYFLPINMLICLSLTIFIEIVVAYILNVRNLKDFINIILVNILTNPLVVTVPFYCNIYYGIMCRNIVLTILEILTVVIEGFIYKKYLNFNKINPYIISLILNFMSYIIGHIMFT